MFCTNCGATINSDVKFCTSCGFKLKDDNFATPKTAYTPPVNPVPKMPDFVNEAELEETQAYYSGSVKEAAMAETFKKSVTEAELEETHDSSPAISSGGGYTPVDNINNGMPVQAYASATVSGGNVATAPAGVPKQHNAVGEGAAFADTDPYRPNVNPVAGSMQPNIKMGGFRAASPVPPLYNNQNSNPAMTQPQMPYNAGERGYGMHNPGYAPSAPQANMPSAYGSSAYSVPPATYAPSVISEDEISAIKAKRFTWHIIAKIMAFITLCVTLWAMVCPFSGYFVQLVDAIIDLGYKANIDAEFLQEANIIVRLLATPMLMVTIALVMVADYGMTSGAVMLIVLVIGYVVLLSAVINFIIYLITTLFGSNKTGFASYATISSLIVSVLIIASTISFNNDLKTVVSQETHGILSERNMDMVLGEMEKKFDIVIDDEPVAPSVAIYLLAISSAATKVTVSISKSYKKKAKRL